MLFRDTDSLVYDIETDDVYEDFYKDMHSFDLSSYPKDSKFFDPVNEKATGKVKDGPKGKINDEFVCIKDVDGNENKTGKGIYKNVVKDIKHERYNNVLFNKRVVRHNKRIQSKLNKIGTYDVCKISLSCFDDKRYVLDDRINNLAYFHKNTRSQ